MITFIGRHLAGKNLWVHLRTGHPQPAPGIKVHLDRLGQVRVLREELDLQPVSLRLNLGSGCGLNDFCSW